MSKELFGVDFEKDLNKWKAIKRKKINNAAYRILLRNNKDLAKFDPAVLKTYIDL
jgi:hypothetical protein